MIFSVFMQSFMNCKNIYVVLCTLS